MDYIHLMIISIGMIYLKLSSTILISMMIFVYEGSEEHMIIMMIVRINFVT